ncbi:MAG: acylneuraminate cytidylyltransferase family protein [bacterium]
MADKKILLIIAARGGSKGVAHKNIRELCGIPLIAHTILQAIQWGGADRIICSTDSDTIASVAKQYGAEVPFKRPNELSLDETGKIDVLKHAVRSVEEGLNERYPVIVDLDVTAPIRTTADIEGAVKLFLDKKPKSVFTVTPCRKNPYFNMVEINDNGYAVLCKKSTKKFIRRQDTPAVYDMNASIYVYDREFLMNPKTTIALSDKTLTYCMSELSAFDIDNESDFQFIDFLVSKGLVKL